MHKAKRILILGGTGEARRAASALLAEGFDVVTSLAGVTTEPLKPEGDVRTGGFGGVAGLVRYINQAGICALVDASHPFAGVITRHGVEAARLCDIPYVRFERREWKPLQGERWYMADDVDQAARAVDRGARLFLTIGRKNLSAFMARKDITVVARTIEAPGFAPPRNWTFITARPPYSREGEEQLMRKFRIDTMVSKNSGGKAVSAKLAAARRLGVKVIMIERPKIAGIRKVRTISQMMKFLPRV